MDLKTISTVLFVIFVILAAVLLILSAEATTYGEFCRAEGYELAGTVGGEKACLIVNDKNVEYRYFSCEPNCSFEGKQKTQLTTPISDLIVDLNKEQEKEAA